jgi:sugar O-acyltransferase (sialic acid O-acetyltransferase NeuD family)
MLIIGAKGFAKEVLEILNQSNQYENVVFYDDLNDDLPEKLYDKFLILTTLIEAENYLKTIDNRFTIGIGNPILRKKLSDKFIALGGILTSTISLNAKFGSEEVAIGVGANILDGTVISNSVTIGVGCIIYYNAVITHDCKVGDFVEISPAAILLGRCKIGSFTQIGANATILPDITIGSNVIIGAGAVVTKDIPDNCLAVGMPAKIIKEITV